MGKRWTRNQKIAVWGLAITFAGIIINLHIQLVNLSRKIQPVIEMKPQINNVINNITKVEKEIANLHEILKQQDALRKTEIFFRIRDLDKKVKIVPPNAATPKAAGTLIIELAKIPFKNSVVVGTQSKNFAPSSIIVERNIIKIPFRGEVQGILDHDTDFISVAYFPDLENHEDLLSIDGMTYEYTPNKINFYFHLWKKHPTNHQP